MSAHTPGPWNWRCHASEEFGEVKDAKGSWVARVHRRNGADPCTPECGANANLIASAPELLQMLEDMVEAHDSTDGKIVGIESARALIRKVRGGA